VSTREEIRRLARALESIAYNATDLSTCRTVARDAIDAEIAKTWAHPPIFYGDQPPGASPTGDARPVQTGDTCPGCVSWVLDGEHNPTCPNLPAPPAETTTTNDKEK
jgi:hypothetical protein